MQSGFGPADELRSLGISVLSDLPGVGRNLDDHLQFGCVWQAADEAKLPPPPRAQAVCFWGDEESAGPPGGPEYVMYSGAAAFMSVEAARAYPPPPNAFTFLLGMRLRSRGSVRLTGPSPADKVRIATGFLSRPDDIRLAVDGIRMAREIAGSTSMRQFCGSWSVPSALSADDAVDYVRRAAVTFWHQCGTAKMGREGDVDAVVDSELRVRGVDGLRVADVSVLPHVTSGNTMAPAVLIGERAARLVRSRSGQHGRKASQTGEQTG
jgi:choline dehydrogenase